MEHKSSVDGPIQQLVPCTEGSSLRSQTHVHGKASVMHDTHDSCKARYAVLFQIRTFPPEPEDEAHIAPTATYDEVIYPGFQHDITTLQIQGYNISYNRHTIA